MATVWVRLDTNFSAKKEKKWHMKVFSSIVKHGFCIFGGDHLQ